MSTPALSLVFDPKISTCSSRSAVVELPQCGDALQPPLMPLARVQSLSRLLRFTFELADQLRTGHLKDDLVTRRLAGTGREAPKSPVPGPVRTIEPCQTIWRTLGSSPRSEKQGPETSGSPGDSTPVFPKIEIRVFEPGNKGNLHSQPNLPTRPRGVFSTPKNAETSRGFAVQPVRAPRPALASTSYAEAQGC